MKIKTYLFLLVVIIFQVNINAQKQIPSLSEERGDICAYQVLHFFNNNKLDSALIAVNEAIVHYGGLCLEEKYVDALNNKSRILYDLDKTNDLVKSIDFALEEANRLLPDNNYYNLSAKENGNARYFEIGNYDKSLEILYEILPNKINQASKLEIAKTYSNIGNNEKNIGEYHNAIKSFRKALKLQYDTIPNFIGSADLYNNIARVHLLDSKIDSALLNLNRSELISRNVNINNPSINYRIETFQLLAEAYIELNNFRLARKYLYKIKSLKPSDSNKVIWNKTYAGLLSKEGKYEESTKYYLKAISLSKSSETRMAPPDQARRFLALGNTYEHLNNIELALNSYQQGLNVLSHDEPNSNISFNPSIDKMLDKADGLQLFHKKAILLSKKYALDENSKWLLFAFEALNRTTSLIIELRKGIQSTESKKSLSERTLPIYEIAINNSLDLYKLKKEEKYLNQAFNYTEQVKALLLLEKLSEKGAKGFGDIPIDLLKKEANLQLQYVYLKNKLVGKNVNFKKNDQLNQINKELDELSSIFEKDYPKYYDLKYNFNPLSIDQCQNTILSDDEALVEYFIGDTTFIKFVLTKDDVSVDRKISKDKVKLITYDLKNIISSPPSAVDSKKELYQFISTSGELSRLLLGNSIERLKKKNINSLIIIPDDFLNSIPFDILVTSETDAPKSYGTNSINYLFEDYNISYNYSATILNTIKSKEKAIFKGDLIAYAPKFGGENLSSIRDCSGAILSNLECNENELSEINKFVSGISRTGKDASAADFINEAKDFKIIHLATHACVDETNSNNSRIYLTGDYLTENVIYNLNLNAEMAVLSACNTGSGEIIKGEGVMNLAKGFLNAGCSSAVMSLWSVDDCTTSDLMSHFYEYIYKGYSKDESLRNAKLSYLKNAKKSKTHPYYWSSFVSFGDMLPIEVKKRSYFNYFVGLMLLLLGYFCFTKIRQKKTT